MKPQLGNRGVSRGEGKLGRTRSQASCQRGHLECSPAGEFWKRERTPASELSRLRSRGTGVVPPNSLSHKGILQRAA